MLQTRVTAHWADHDKAEETLKYLDEQYGHMTETVFEAVMQNDRHAWLEFDLRASYSEAIPAEDIILLYLYALNDAGVTFSWTNIHQGNKIYYSLSAPNIKEFRDDARLLSRWRDSAIYGLL